MKGIYIVKNDDITVMTTDTVPGYDYVVLGTVYGIVGQSRSVSTDLKHMLGGNSKQYEKKLTESYQEALNKLKENAKKLKADAVVGTRFSVESVAQDMQAVIAYGTAVDYIQSDVDDEDVVNLD